MDIVQLLHFRKYEKKSKIGLLIILCLFAFSSCTFLENSAERVFDHDAYMVKKYVKKMVNAIQCEDKDAFTELFSATAIGDSEMFLNKVDELFSFIQGEIISFGSTPGVASDSDYEYGKRRTVVYASYWIETEIHRYYLAIRVCTLDTFDKNNIGIKSIYIIDADEWKEDYEYGGDGNWTPGINIDGDK